MTKHDTAYLAGKALISMPNMSDPRFQRAVVFMCAHDENGAMGLVVNHAIPGIEFDQLLGQLDIESDIRIDLKTLQIPVMNGGPVENSRGFLLHSADFNQPDTIIVDPHFSVSGTIEALKDVARGAGPSYLLFALGYAGWGPGQLDREIQDSAWLVVEADSDLIFTTPPAEKWEAALQKLGIDPSMLSSYAGRA